MGNFFAELKRRHIYRVAVAYTILAWLLLQVFNNLTPILKLPDWIGMLLLILLIGGFPIALLFAWIQQLAPARAANVPLQLAPSEKPALSLPAGLAPTERASLPPSPPAGISIAVLPFANMSGDASQEFFSDGMTEEITAALAQIKALRVVGRTSAFQFKGENKDLRAIGKALSASYLIEGSVRKAGNRVRITAQLIHAGEDCHLWAQSYDRELTDVFAIQENIALAIAASLEVPLGLKEGENLVSNRTRDTDSYQDYLRAKAFVRARGPLEPGGPLTDAIKLLEQVVARDANYAPAWGLLGQAYALTPSFSAALVNGSTAEFRRIAAELLQKAETAAQQATQLDPNNVDGYTALAFARNYRGWFVQAEDLYRHALFLDPGNSEALHQYGLMLATVGRLKDSLPLRQRLQGLEPLVPVFNRVTAEVLWLNGRDAEAIRILKELPSAFGVRIRLAEVYASMGEYGEAAETLQQIPSGIFLPGAVEEAVHVLRTAPAPSSHHATLQYTRLGFVYLYVGAAERVLDFFESLAQAEHAAVGNPMSRLWAPSYAPVRKTERFKAFVRKAGMVDYWRARGWADLCRPVGADDFMCD